MSLLAVFGLGGRPECEVLLLQNLPLALFRVHSALFHEVQRSSQGLAVKNDRAMIDTCRRTSVAGTPDRIDPCGKLPKFSARRAGTPLKLRVAAAGIFPAPNSLPPNELLSRKLRLDICPVRCRHRRGASTRPGRPSEGRGRGSSAWPRAGSASTRRERTPYAGSRPSMASCSCPDMEQNT